MIKWKSLKKNIPTHVKVGNNEYEVLYTDDFKGGKTAGEMRPDLTQIVIRNGLGAKETVLTFFHEFLHSVSEEYKVGLTEPQVLALEQSFNEFKKLFHTIEGKK